MAEKNNIIDIVNGISQAAANAYDGALDEKGEPIKIGLWFFNGEWYEGTIKNLSDLFIK